MFKWLWSEKLFSLTKMCRSYVCCGSQTNSWLCLIAEIFGYLYPKVNSSDFFGIHGFRYAAYVICCCCCWWSWSFFFLLLIFPLFGTLAQSFCWTHHDARCANRFSIFLHVMQMLSSASNTRIHTYTYKHTRIFMRLAAHHHTSHATKRHTEGQIPLRIFPMIARLPSCLACTSICWWPILPFVTSFFSLDFSMKESSSSSSSTRLTINMPTHNRPLHHQSNTPISIITWTHECFGCPSILQHESTRNYSKTNKKK